MNERWLPVAGYEGSYEISSRGNLRSLDREVPSRWGGTRPYPGKQHAPRDIGKYFQYTLSHDRTVKQLLAHRLVALAFIPNPEGKLYVNHKDGDGHNNDLSNLEWSTQPENQLHAYATGLQKPQRGMANHRTKLADDDVAAIRQAWQRRDVEPVTQNGLAQRYGTDQGTVSRIVNNRARTELGSVA